MWEKGRDVDEVAGAGHRYTITGSVEWESTSYVTLPRISLIGCCPSDYEHVDELVDRRRLQALLIAAQLENRLAPLLRKAAGEVPAKFLFEQGNAFVAAAAMAQRILYRHLASLGSVFEENLQLICDRALPGIEIIARVALVLDADHLGAQRVDTRVPGDVVFVVGGSEIALDQADGNHVLDAVVAVGGVVERSLLVDDADRGFVRDDLDFLDVGKPVFSIVLLHRHFMGRQEVPDTPELQHLLRPAQRHTNVLIHGSKAMGDKDVVFPEVPGNLFARQAGI